MGISPLLQDEIKLVDVRKGLINNKCNQRLSMSNYFNIVMLLFIGNIYKNIATEWTLRALDFYGTCRSPYFESRYRQIEINLKQRTVITLF